MFNYASASRATSSADISPSPSTSINTAYTRTLPAVDTVVAAWIKTSIVSDVVTKIGHAVFASVA